MSPNWIVPFLEQLAIDGNASRAARVAGKSSTVVYAYRKEDADFAEAWRLALEDAGDNLVAEARRRAVDGVNEPVIYQGMPTPVWERDAHGQPVMEEYQAGTNKETGEPIVLQRPVQARDRDGSLVWLTLNKKSDPLLMLLMKGFKKQLFADRTELTGADGGPVHAVDDTTKYARLALILDKVNAAKRFEDLA